MTKHDHHKHCCAHENLAYCKVCDVAYCKDCGHEWPAYKYGWNFPYNPWWTTTTTPADSSGTIQVYADSGTATHAHKHGEPVEAHG